MRTPSVSTPSGRRPSTGTLPIGSSRTLPGANRATALAPVGGSAATAAGGPLVAGDSPQALAGSVAPRALLRAQVRRALTHGSLTRPQLARVVARLHGCLGQLAPEERRVLVLLAGLGPRPDLSPSQVARRLGLGVARTRRIERHGLRRLGALDGAGRCVAGGAVMFEAVVASGPFGLPDGSTPTNGGVAVDRSRGGVEGVSSSGGGGDDGSALGAALPPPLGQGSDWTLLLMLMVAALVVLLVRRELRRQRGH